MPDPTTPFQEGEFRLSETFFAAHGAHFITLCAYRNRYLFGAATGNPPAINEAGQLVLAEWPRLAERTPAIQLDAFAALPNHFHAILSLDERLAADQLALAGNPGQSALEALVEQFKAAAARRIQDQSEAPAPLWQPGLHARPIKSQQALAALRTYVHENGLNWALDPLNPDGLRPNPKCLVPEAGSRHSVG